VLAPSKRRASFYTLPIVVLIGFLIVAGLVAWQRAGVIADLSDQVAHGDKAEATAAVRQLAAIPKPPLSVLVDAATSDEHTTAEAAQVAINRLLSKWQQYVEKNERINSVASQLTELAAALADQRREFGAEDYPWLTSATRKVMQLALKCPATKTPLVALHCDEVMSYIERDRSSAPIVGREELSDDGQPIDAAPISEVERQESRQANLEGAFSGFSTQQFWSEGDVGPAAPIAMPSDASLGVNSGRDGNANSATNDGHVRVGVQSSDASAGQAPAPISPPQRPEWALPLLRFLPATPMTTTATDAAPLKLEPPRVSSAAPVARVADTDTRKLLERWLASKGEETQFVAHDLATRGFKRLPRQLVEQYLSNNLDDRLHLVDSVLTEPGVDARPWLILLSDDTSAEVRLAVVTIMATSNDKTLVEKAWQVAIRDRDPRIADLASRLKERRGGALLR
jgi:hypothetical protein